MSFCTSCGNKIQENHRFCGVCGTSIDPPKESESFSQKENETISSEQLDNVYQNANFQREMFFDSNTVYRKTLFDDGMLVLSSRELILYSSDEKDELKRIPISSIHSCGYSTLRRGLMIKRRINEEDNF